MIFDPIKINRLELRNRFVRSATHEGMATPEGLYTPELTKLLVELAEGEVGLIISGHAFVSPEGRAGRFQASAATDESIGPWRETLSAVHAAGGKMVLQLAHAGGAADDREAAVGPSPFAMDQKRPACREISVDEIKQVIRSFAGAARRAQEAGFDGVQIHAAHGYLISEFLSGALNHRTDEYGGNPENRARLLNEVANAIRAAVGPDYPVLAKINSEDFVPGGFTPDECAAVCGMLPVDAVELSGKLPWITNEPNGDKHVYYEAAARKIKSMLKVPVILTGGIREAAVAERLLKEKACDCIGLSRPLIREPHLVKRWHTGDTAKAKCITCNVCFRPVIRGKGLYCPVEKKICES